MKFSIWPKLWRQAKSENDDLKKKIETQAHQLGNQGYRIHNQRKEIERQIAQNAKLKDILKECRRYIDIWGYTDTHGNALLPQIDEVLK